MGVPGLRVIEGGRAEADGPRASLRDLYARYGGSVYGRCVYILKDKARAEDAMQDVFAKALEHLDGFRAEASPQTWLLRIATNHCLNLLREGRALWRDRYRQQEQAHEELSVERDARAIETRELVRKLLARFDVETQQAAIHYHVDEMTLDEVAAALGRSVPTVRKRLEAFAAAAAKELA